MLIEPLHVVIIRIFPTYFKHYRSAKCIKHCTVTFTVFQVYEKSVGASDGSCENSSSKGEVPSQSTSAEGKSTVGKLRTAHISCSSRCSHPAPRPVTVISPP